jgi:hypothetical protein
MKKTTDLVSITKPKIELSKQQKLFNQRVEKIDALQNRLKTIQELLGFAKTEYSRQIIPHREAAFGLDEDFILFLDKNYQDKIFTKKEKEKIAFLITDIAFNLIEEKDREDLIPLHDRYAVDSYQEKVDSAKNESLDMFSRMFGMDLDKEDIDFSEEGTAKLHQKLGEHLENKQKEEAERMEQEKAQAPQPRKTKKQKEKEEVQKFEKANIRKICRSIYLNLVKSLHPDKELDEAKKAWKTELMSQVTVAYETNNFFELLKLQSKFLHAEQNQHANIAEEDLKYYNQILQEQIKEIENQIEMVQFSNPFESTEVDFGELINGASTTEQVSRRIKKEVDTLKNDNQIRKQEIALFGKDLKAFKTSLKQFDMPLQDSFGMQDILSILNGMR